MRTLMVLSLFILMGLGSPMASKDQKQSVFIEVTKKTKLFNQYQYPARIHSINQAIILSEDQGVVSKLHVRLGQKVKKNAKILAIKRLDPIYKYRDLVMRAPISGVVSKIFNRSGTTVAKSDKLVSITDPSRQKIDIQVPATELNYLKVGMKGNFIWKDTKLSVQIIGISPYIEPTLASATVELSVDNNKSVPLGTQGLVRFRTNERQSIMIPTDAIVFRGTKRFIRTIKDVDGKKQVDETPIITGLQRGSQSEVIKGATSGQWVIIRTSGYLKKGDLVEVKNLPKPETEATKGAQESKEEIKNTKQVSKT